MPPFAFRMRAYAAAHFEFDDVLHVAWPEADAWLQSEYTGGEDGRAYPVTIHAEIRGEAGSIEEAEPRLANMIGLTLPLIALASNAAVDDPLAVATYGLDLTSPQPLIGYHTPRATDWFPPGARKIDTAATLALMTAVGHHPQGESLHRAIESYRRAVGHWVPEQQLLAGEFLFIAAETLSRFLIESRAAAKHISRKNLVRLSGLGKEATLRRRYLEDEIFAGDADALSALENASDGFEHGYMSVDDVRGLLKPVLERSFGYVRRALIAGSGMDASDSAPLLTERYEEPRGLVPAMRFVHAELSRADTSQPPPRLDVAPFELEWGGSPPTAVRRPDGRIDLTFTDTITITRTPENMAFRPMGFGLRAAHIKPSDADRDEPSGASDDES